MQEIVEPLTVVAVIPMFNISYHSDYDVDFMDAFDKESMTVIEEISSHRHEGVYSDDSEVFFVDSNGVEAYFVDVSFEDGKHDPENRADDLINVYKAALRLGVKVPTAVFGDGWWALKPFDGGAVGSLEKEEILQRNGHIERGQFRGDCAKLLILGYIDCAQYNMLVESNGDFRHLDIQSSNTSVKENYSRFVCNLTQKMQAWNLQPAYFMEIEELAIILSEYLSQNDVIDEYLTSQIKTNLEEIPEVLPVHRMGTAEPEDVQIEEVGSMGIPSREEIEPVISRF